jgi:2-desacetyl-2-hydroxyethyl bacteriochlorophyllide A dehydrogenase
MNAAAYVGKGRMEVVEVPYPTVSPEGVIIKIMTCGVCGSDLHVFREGLFLETSSREIGGYRVLGHEFGGEIVEAGERVEDFKVGDRVTCAHTKGGYAEYIHIEKAAKNDNVFHLPDEISFRTAATLEPLFTSYHGVMLSRPEVGESAVVIGGGIVGLGIVQILKALYFTKIIVVDLSDKRLEMAKALGADATINPSRENPVDRIAGITGSRPVRYLDRPSPLADIVYECAGAGGTPQQAFDVARPNGGRVVIIALYEKLSSVDFNTMVCKNMTVHGSLGYSSKDILQTMEVVRAGRIDRERLITHEFKLSDIQTAFESQLNLGGTIKAIVHMN